MSGFCPAGLDWRCWALVRGFCRRGGEVCCLLGGFLPRWKHAPRFPSGGLPRKRFSAVVLLRFAGFALVLDGGAWGGAWYRRVCLCMPSGGLLRRVPGVRSGVVCGVFSDIFFPHLEYDHQGLGVDWISCNFEFSMISQSKSHLNYFVELIFLT